MADAKKNPTLRDLIPQPVPVPLGDVTLMVAPMGWERGCRALDALGDAIGHLPKLGDARTSGEQVADWVAFARTFQVEVSEFCAIACDEPSEVINALPPSTIVEVLLGVLQVNADFFAQSLPAMVQRLAGRLQELQARLGAAVDTARAAAFTTSSSA